MLPAAACIPTSPTPSSLIFSRKAGRLTVSKGAQGNHNCCNGTKAGAQQTLCCSPSLQHDCRPTSPYRCRAPPLPQVPPGRTGVQATQLRAMRAARAPLCCKLPVVHSGSAVATAARTVRTACAAAGWASCPQPHVHKRLERLRREAACAPFPSQQLQLLQPRPFWRTGRVSLWRCSHVTRCPSSCKFGVCPSSSAGRGRSGRGCPACGADAQLAALLLQDSLRPSLLINLGEIGGLPDAGSPASYGRCALRRQAADLQRDVGQSQTFGLVVGSSAGCAASCILQQQSSSTSLQLSKPGTTLRVRAPLHSRMAFL